MRPEDIVPGAIIEWRIGRHAGRRMRILHVRARGVLVEMDQSAHVGTSNRGSHNINLPIVDLEARADLVRPPRPAERRRLERRQG